MQSVVVQFKGFSPSEKTKKFFEELIFELKEEGPKSSVARATIIKDHADFKANLKMTSHAGVVFVSVHGPNHGELVHKLVQQARKQLGKWKHSKIHHPGLSDLSQVA